jgi:hypothetical protein
MEQRVLNAVRDKLMGKDLFEEFCEEYTREMNRLRMERRLTNLMGSTSLACLSRALYGRSRANGCRLPLARAFKAD